MERQTLTAEQMKRLSELGIEGHDASLILLDEGQQDVSLAYMGNAYMKITDYSKSLVSLGVASYVYTLQDVLQKLPKKIYAQEVYTLRITPVSSRLWNIAYVGMKEEDEKESVLKSFASSLLDAAYKMLCWAQEEKK